MTKVKNILFVVSIMVFIWFGASTLEVMNNTTSRASVSDWNAYHVIVEVSAWLRS